MCFGGRGRGLLCLAAFPWEFRKPQHKTSNPLIASDTLRQSGAFQIQSMYLIKYLTVVMVFAFYFEGSLRFVVSLSTLFVKPQICMRFRIEFILIVFMFLMYDMG